MDEFERLGLESVYTEQFVVNDEFKAAGTFDNLIRLTKDLRCEALDLTLPAGLVCVGDIKTGSIEYGVGKMIVQFCGYSRSSFYNPETYQRAPLAVDGEEVSWAYALLISMPAGAGECNIYPVDIAQGYEDMKLAWDVRQFRKRKPTLSTLVCA